MNTAFLLIGGNLGDREEQLATARNAIDKHCGQLLRQSSLYQTAAWGLEAQASFLNQALALTTALSPGKLLESIFSIEEKMGRQRDVRYGPRLIDIDILLYGSEVVEMETLSIPHPQLPYRRFALIPLAEIAAGVVHPVLKKPIRQLLAECPDTLDVQKIS